MAQSAFVPGPLQFVSSMLYQIASFLLDVVGGLLTGACLLRLYMQWQRVPFSNPIGGLVFALTDWLVMPLRRVIAPVGRWDLSSLAAAVLLQLVQYFFAVADSGCRCRLGLAALAGAFWPGAGGHLGADWFADCPCGHVMDVDPLADCGRGGTFVCTGAAAVSAHYSAGRRGGFIAAGRAGVAAGCHDHPGAPASRRAAGVRVILCQISMQPLSSKHGMLFI